MRKTLLFLVVFTAMTGLPAADEKAVEPTGPSSEPQTIRVSWEFGSGPDRTSNRWVGEKDVPLVYDSAECRSRFTLAGLRHECPLVYGGDGERACPAFLRAKFIKHVEGVTELPELAITRPVYKSGKPTRKSHTDTVFFPRELARPVDDWNASEIEILAEFPAPDLHNPFGWTEVRVICD